ncbi:hypothetical protein [Streptomyces sp. NPDC059479]|uniref:hypothetical protein n=1 Tax=Streptomyces sp. NPDC059479 TaxID=3346848 RepID=UPI003686460F
MGRDAERWRTFQGTRTVAVAARTVTSTVRLLETLPAVVRGDSRVTVVFAYDSTSAFSAGVVDLLKDAGCRILPWTQLADVWPDLLISASENIDVPPGDWPVLVLPHGIGFQKMVPDSRAEGVRLSGLVPDTLLDSGRAWLAVSHPDQEKQLITARPETAGRTVLIGDPVLDELRASASHARIYREALGLARGQRLVVLSSTWGPTSLLGQDPGLPARLLAALPYDGYRLAAVIHPNVWAGHGAWQIRTLLADAMDAGLLLMPPVNTWRAALVASDFVIGDHGSVTLYGAALGKPILLGTFGSDAVPGTAMARLGRAAPRLDPRADVRRQVEAALDTHTPDRFADIVAGAFSRPGHALARLRTTVYGLLGLSEPGGTPPPVLSLPRPDLPAAEVTSWLVRTSVEFADGRAVVTAHRCPSAVSDGESSDEAPGEFIHLAADDHERDARVSESSSVLLRHQTAPTSVAALRWIREVLDRYPGSYLAGTAVAGAGYLVGIRDGRVVEVSTTGPALDAGLPASLVYTCLRGRIPLDTTVTLRADGVHETDAVLRLRTRG